MQDSRNETREMEDAIDRERQVSDPIYRKKVEMEVKRLMKKLRNANLKSITIDGGYEIDYIDMK